MFAVFKYLIFVLIFCDWFKIDHFNRWLIKKITLHQELILFCRYIFIFKNDFFFKFQDRAVYTCDNGYKLGMKKMTSNQLNTKNNEMQLKLIFILPTLRIHFWMNSKYWLFWLMTSLYQLVLKKWFVRQVVSGQVHNQNVIKHQVLWVREGFKKRKKSDFYHFVVWPPLDSDENIFLFIG